VNDIDIVDQERHGRVVVWDAHGEPVAWLAVGEPVLGTMYNGAGLVAYTHMLTVEEAINVYGPISEWVTGPGGGFRRVCFGTTWFSTPDVVGGFARDTLSLGVITIEDADLEWPCPQCGAPPGQTCQGITKHRVRRARGEEYQRLKADIDRLRDTVANLERQNSQLTERLDAMRRKQRKRVPICNRPTRTGKPCQADAIMFPMAIESCRVHLTTDERAALDAATAQRNAEFAVRLHQPDTPYT